MKKNRARSTSFALSFLPWTFVTVMGFALTGCEASE